MSPQEKAPPLRRRGEPMRRAVFEVVVRLLTEQGPEAVTMAGVAAAAGVHESSLYRQFGTREKMIFEAATRYSDEALPARPAGDDIADDLRSTMRALIEYLNTPQGAALVRLSAVPVSPEFDQERTAYWHRRLDRSADVVRHGVETGQLKADTDPTLVVDALAGPVLARLALFHEVMAMDDVMRLVDQVLRGITV
ncbi:TetR-like C-terminal domain-containing protein [Catenulispora pinisilvae]|uniref:TetR-like C-terminal domain-containing protein n=1 Tax=Catenulispora pinisilvae TaxID=2705253 RepID=UPI00189220ED|nr:TetR-like C-terminal domain-containing protein [Catenulispora pinisilvae]